MLHSEPYIASFYLIVVACTVRESAIIPGLYAFLSQNFALGRYASHSNAQYYPIWNFDGDVVR